MNVKLSPDPMPDEGIFTRSDHYRFVEQGVPAAMRDGVILRLEESMGEVVTRDAVTTSYLPNVALAPGALDFTFPSDTVFVY